jgi:glycosyltransferase involved in cell wall biosynthesis
MTVDLRVSVITVTRNDLAGLRATVASVDEQTYGSVAHLIIDGASSDGTSEFLSTLSGRVVVSEPDGGIFDAMNKGLRLAGGDILVFLNSGDTFSSPDSISSVITKWGVGGAAWGYGAMRYVNGARDPVAGDVQAPFNLRRMELGLNFVPQPAMYISRSLACAMGEFDESFGVAADQEWILRAAYAAPPMVWIEFLTDFLAGGAHTSVGQLSRAMLYHRMRRKHGRMLGGTRLTDWVAAMIVGLAWVARDVLAKPFAREKVAL